SNANKEFFVAVTGPLLRRPPDVPPASPRSLEATICVAHIELRSGNAVLCSVVLSWSDRLRPALCGLEPAGSKRRRGRLFRRLDRPNRLPRQFRCLRSALGCGGAAGGELARPRHTDRRRCKHHWAFGNGGGWIGRRAPRLRGPAGPSRDRYL